jgi:hypothetical protein
MVLAVSLGVGSSEQRLGNSIRLSCQEKGAPEKVFLKVSSVLPC